MKKTSKKYFKDFDNWNTIKKNQNYSRHKPPIFQEREIWWTSIGINIGYEEDGKNKNFVRPVLVIRKFNQELFFGAPMSTKLKKNKYYLSVSLEKKNVSVLISQLRAFSSKRILNKLARLDHKNFKKVIKKIEKIFFASLSEKRES